MDLHLESLTLSLPRSGRRWRKNALRSTGSEWKDLRTPILESIIWKLTCRSEQLFWVSIIANWSIDGRLVKQSRNFEQFRAVRFPGKTRSVFGWRAGELVRSMATLGEKFIDAVGRNRCTSSFGSTGLTTAFGRWAWILGFGSQTRLNLTSGFKRFDDASRPVGSFSQGGRNHFEVFESFKSRIRL